MQHWFALFWVSVLCLAANEIEAEISGWNADPNTQYHIQTDEGPERYFRFQTLNGQYRKEKRLADGTVVGTEGWVDPLGYLRIKDYIADGQGYRILKSKMIFMGNDKSLANSVPASKNVPARSGILTRPRRPPNPFRQPELKDVSNGIEVNTVRPLSVFSSTPSSLTSASGPDFSTTYLAPTTYRPRPFSLTTPAPYDADDFSLPSTNYLSSDYGYRTSLKPPYQRPYQVSKPPFVIQPPFNRRRGYGNAQNSVSREKSYDAPEYDGTHSTADGFQYYLKTHYHEEERQPGDGRLGSFGYVDPFGIRRVIYYKADGTRGFMHKKK